MFPNSLTRILIRRLSCMSFLQNHFGFWKQNCRHVFELDNKKSQSNIGMYLIFQYPFSNYNTNMLTNINMFSKLLTHNFNQKLACNSFPTTIFCTYTQIVDINSYSNTRILNLKLACIAFSTISPKPFWGLIAKTIICFRMW